MPKRLTREESTATPTYAKFIAEPFEAGYGHTIGNSMRRVLLSSLEGAAINLGRKLCIFERGAQALTAEPEGLRRQRAVQRRAGAGCAQTQVESAGRDPIDRTAGRQAGGCDG